MSIDPGLEAPFEQLADQLRDVADELRAGRLDASIVDRADDANDLIDWAKVRATGRWIRSKVRPARTVLVASAAFGITGPATAGHLLDPLVQEYGPGAAFGMAFMATLTAAGLKAWLPEKRRLLRVAALVLLATPAAALVLHPATRPYAAGWALDALAVAATTIHDVTLGG